MLSCCYKLPMYLVCIMLLAVTTLYAETPASPELSNDPGYKAFVQSAEDKKFLMVQLYSATPDSTQEKSCLQAQKAMEKSLNVVSLDIKSSNASFLVKKFNLNYAPLPIVIIIAPNGVIAGSFRSSFTPDQVKSTFRTPKTLAALLAFQQRKIVFISAQGKDTAQNKESLESITRFNKENPLYGKPEIIKLDPKDSSEAPLLKQLNIKPDITIAQTFLMVPPGRILGRWDGATDPNEFVKQLNLASKSCSKPSCADPNCK